VQQTASPPNSCARVKVPTFSDFLDPPVLRHFDGGRGSLKTAALGVQSSDFFGLFDSPVSVACRVDASRSVPFLSPNVEQQSTKPDNEAVP
jgi:hypothetical protein